jgi:hypothetical protein
MKLKIVWLLLIAVSAGKLVQAQFRYDEVYKEPQMSEIIFDNSRPGDTNVYFDFFLPKGNKVGFGMNKIKQLLYVPNLDSLFAVVKNTLLPLKDSMKADAYVRRIDYLAYASGAPTIRILTHSGKPPSFTYKNNELVQLKIESDTLSISLWTLTGQTVKWVINDTVSHRPDTRLFSITLKINNVADLYDLPEATLSQCLNRVKQETQKYLSSSKNHDEYSHYRASFNMTTGKMTTPYYSQKRIQYNGQKSLLPTVHAAFQYARGSFIPSVAAGMQYVTEQGQYSNDYLSFLWEPYFYFTRDDNGKLVTQRNDFITLQYMTIDKKKDYSRLQTTGNISVGYLAGRRGDLFEENTFKVGLPCFVYGNLKFEPELFFNGAFRNFSPSLKLVLLFE